MAFPARCLRSRKRCTAWSIARVDEELETADSLEGNYLPGANLIGRAQECSVSLG